MYNQYVNYIFDFDGTICDSFDVTISILNKYAARFGKKHVTKKDFEEKGIEKLIHEYKFSKLQVFLYVLVGRRELSKCVGDLKTFTGLSEVLKELAQKNRLGIVSSNSKSNIEKFLTNNKIDQCFDFIYSSPNLFQKAKKIRSAMKKYKLETKETYYIGDEIRDIRAAGQAKVKIISVSWGFEGKKLLSLFKPDFLIDKPEELMEIQ